MSKKLDLIRERKQKIAHELAQIDRAERELEAAMAQRRERRIVRSIRKLGLLSFSEVVLMQEISDLAKRLRDADKQVERAARSTTKSADGSDVQIEIEGDDHGN